LARLKPEWRSKWTSNPDMKPISQLTDKALVALTTDELALAIREEALLQGVTPPTEWFELTPTGVAFNTAAKATAQAANVARIVLSPTGGLTAIMPDGGVASRFVDAPDMAAFTSIRDTGLARFAVAQANDGISRKMIAKRDAFLAAAGGDVALATKFWNIENPTTPWPA
jgi:hypothetical protein